MNNPTTVGARHPRPTPNEKIENTLDGHRPTVGHRGLKPNLIKSLFLKMGDDLQSVSDRRRECVFLLDLGCGWRTPTAFGFLIKTRSY